MGSEVKDPYSSSIKTLEDEIEVLRDEIDDLRASMEEEGTSVGMRRQATSTIERLQGQIRVKRSLISRMEQLQILGKLR